MQFTKHIWVLQKLSTIPRIEASDPPRPSWRSQRPAVRMSLADANATWDHLFEYIHHNWDIPSTAAMSWWTQTSGDCQAEIFDCRVMLEMDPDELEAKLESLPPYFTESIFPVAVARYLLRDLALPFNHRQTTTFTEFHNRYGKMILA